MTEDPLYTHHQSGRRPLTYGAALFVAGMFGVGLWGGAPWYWWIPTGFAGLGIAGLLAANPQAGALLTRDSLRFFDARQDRTLRMAEIAAVETHSWTDGPDEVTLTLVSGEKVALPAECIDRRFVPALQQAGVPLQD